MHSGLRTRVRRLATIGLGTLFALGPGLAAPVGEGAIFRPLVAEYEFLSGSDPAD